MTTGGNGADAAGVEVGVLSFNALFETSDLPLAIDSYQRDFVWNDEKVRQLYADLLEYSQLGPGKPPYYMGSILLHSDRDKSLRFIIDGQQRLTALCVLHHHLKAHLPPRCSLRYSPASARRIRVAAQIYDGQARRLDPRIFDDIQFTTIGVGRVDLAFTFFDTQNNRGVPLHATDLLKAYHLRAIEARAGDKEQLQGACARRWEEIQQGASVLSAAADFTPKLFTTVLWRARRWRGVSVPPAEHDGLLQEFEQDALPVPDPAGAIPLYRSRTDRRGTLRIEGDGSFRVQAADLPPSGSDATDLPFSIRQPIHRGPAFFLYTDKYASMLRALMSGAGCPPEVARWRDVHDQLVTANSAYLREVFLLASLMYVDQFRTERLWEFSLWTEHATGAIRLSQEVVKAETAQNMLKDASANLLDVIAHAFHPEEVLRHLRKRPHAMKAYAEAEVDLQDKGVRGRYVRALLKYYGKEGLSLAGKPDWIDQKLAAAR